ncbi:MAG: hypothetical protein ACREE4_02060 [Stellaceae bacterium]
MLIDRYPPPALFAFVPKLLCDFEPVLRERDHWFDDDAIVRRIKADPARRAPHSLSPGRPSTPVRHMRAPAAPDWTNARFGHNPFDFRQTRGVTKASPIVIVPALCRSQVRLSCCPTADHGFFPFKTFPDRH